MADGTHIQWAEASVNPIRARDRETGKRGWFCTRVSDACKNCYASDKNANRFYGTGHEYTVANLAKVELYLEPKVLQEVIGWQRPRTIFWCSMTDLFGEFVPDAWIDQVLAAIALSPQHRHIILTKRIARASEYLSREGRNEHISREIIDLYCQKGAPTPSVARGFEARKANATARGLAPVNDWPRPNVIIGASVENQEWADKRRPAMERIAALGWPTWVSNEPALGDIDWSGWEFLSWMVSGGESGARAKIRECRLEWIRQSRDWCRANGVPWFNKQLGGSPTVRAEENPRLWPDKLDWGVEATPTSTRWCVRLRDRKGGTWDEWPEDLRVREMPRWAS